MKYLAGAEVDTSNGIPEVRFVKGASEETVTIVWDETGKKLAVIQKTKHDELIDKIQFAADLCEVLQGEEFSTCVAEAVIKEVSKITESKSLVSQYRDSLSNRLRQYVCADDEASLTKSSSNSSYFSTNGRNYLTETLLDSSHIKIYRVGSFLTADECQLLTNYHKQSASNLYDRVSYGSISLFDRDATDPIRFM